MTLTVDNKVNFDLLLLEIKQGKVITTDLTTKSREDRLFWWYRTFLCIFLRVLGDSYSDLRAENVAKALFNYCEKNKLGDCPEELHKVIQIVDFLYQKKRGKKEKIQFISDQLTLMFTVATKCKSLKGLVPNDPVMWTPKVLKNIQWQVYAYSYAVSFIEKYFSKEAHVYTYLLKEETRLPANLIIYYDRKRLDFTRIFLELAPIYIHKDVSEGESFDVVSGKYFQYLEYFDSISSTFYLDLKEILPEAIDWNKVPMAWNNKIKISLYLKKYTKTLAGLINRQASLSVDHKLAIIEQLLKALKLLHLHNRFHLNIGLEQVVYRKTSKEEYEVRFKNLGSAHSIEEQIGFSSDHPDILMLQPWLIVADSLNQRSSTIEQFKIEKMYKMDLWNMGLVVSALLLGKCQRVKSTKGDRVLPSLDSITNGINLLNGKQQLAPEHAQRKIDEECKAKQGECTHDTMKALWELVSQMLQLDNFNRIDAIKAYKQFQKIKDAHRRLQD